ncbi:MAG TPA: [NiFe]-hydrogenase assembly chaperone HybE [Steroidobacteraceae bacterium]|nr:[NiFe]-hydrogenase assembly chaperone HybE [Steroidobacteraceae bacterium]
MNAAADSVGRPADERALEQVFERIHRERMADLPLLNDRLRVEALGFRDHQGVRVGALVTPWSINLVILPPAAAPQALGPPGQSRSWTFPSGEYLFDAAEEPALGGYAQCSLFSPAFEFERHEHAVAAARAALEALFDPPPPPQPARLSRRGLLLGG